MIADENRDDNTEGVELDVAARNVERLLDHASPEEPAAEFVERVEDAMYVTAYDAAARRTSRMDAPSKRTRLFVRWCAAAAGIVIVIGMGALLLQPDGEKAGLEQFSGNSNTPTSDRDRANQEDKSVAGSSTILLPDSTAVDQQDPIEVVDIGTRQESAEPAFKREGPDGALRVSYADIDLQKLLNNQPVTLEAVQQIPDWLKKLSGQRIRIRGFMFPPFEETGLVEFVLAHDNQICCFGRDPKISDRIQVTMRDGVTADYIQRRFDVAGVFEIRPDQNGDKLYQLYRLNDAVIVQR